MRDLRARIMRQRPVMDLPADTPASTRLVPVQEGTTEPTGVTKGGGYATATLNHLAGPNPQEELDELSAEERTLLARLHRVIEAKVRLQMHMALAGTLDRGEMAVES